MFADFATPADLSFPRFAPKSLFARMMAALVAAEARAKLRRDYRRLLASDDMMRDVGICRDDVRKALQDLDAA